MSKDQAHGAVPTVSGPRDGSRPFAGLSVIDAASWIAAPTAAMILGDLGADVIKIEPPGEGDPYRALVDNTALPQSGVNHTWILDGRCKRSLTLNLKSKGMNRSVTAILEGINLDLLLPTETSGLELCVPGGNSVPVTADFAGDDATADGDGDGIPELLIKFDRQALIASIRAGIIGGQIEANSTVVLTIKAGGGFVLGTDTIRIRGN